MANKLGTLEFCSALNGHDYDQIRDILKRFVRTVQKERIEAFSTTSERELSGSEDGSDLSSDSEKEFQQNGNMMKKRNVEKWKLDKMAYGVPYVGTSTHKGSTGIMKPKCWPTGFLEAYLDQSPNAMELLGEDLQRSLKNNRDNNLRNLFLRAMRELVTYAIPSHKVDIMENRKNVGRRELSSKILHEVRSIDSSVTSIVMKEHIKRLFAILNDHASTETNHRLLVSTLEILRYLSKTSVETAREIVRTIDSQMKDGVLQKLVAYRCTSRERKDGAEPATGDDMKTQTISLNVQTALIDLAISLLEYNDSTIMLFISSSGSKESKLKAGILYLGLRASLNQNKKFVDKIACASKKVEEAHQLSSYYLLHLVRKHICGKSDRGGSDVPTRVRSTSSNKVLVDLLRGDSLEKMIYIFCSRDNSDFILSKIKKECKKTIITILSDNKCSPFLAQLNAADEISVKASSLILQQVNKTLQHLMAMSPGIDTRNFVSLCFKGTPSIFPYWMRTLTIPELKPSFRCLSMFSLIGFMLQHGPHTIVKDEDSIVFQEIDKKKVYDFLVSNIVPRALTKSLLTKAIQSPNPFLVTETLKLISIVLRRFKEITEDAANKNRKSFEYLAKELALRMPDLQIILAIRSKFDPNLDGIKFGPDQQLYRNHTFIIMNLCKVLQMYASLFTDAFRTIRFDWVKLLSSSPQKLMLAPLSLQHRLLSTMALIQNCLKRIDAHTKPMLSQKAYDMYTGILLQTENETIFNIARRLVLHTITSIIHLSQPKNGSCANCIEYELSLWVDGITNSTAAIFGKLLDTMHQVTFQHATVVTNAWCANFDIEKLPKIPFSPLLSLALVGIATNDDAFPAPFVTLTRNICLKLLFYQQDMRLLACLLKNLVENCAEDCNMTKFFGRLYITANSILHNEGGKTRNFEINAAVKSFGQNNVHSILARLANPKHSEQGVVEKMFRNVGDGNIAHDLATIIICQCIHHLRDTYSSSLYKLVKTILPYVLLQENLNAFICINILNLDPCPDRCVLQLILKSFPVIKEPYLQQTTAASWRGTLPPDDIKLSRQLLLLTAGALEQNTTEANVAAFGALCKTCSNLDTENVAERPHLSLLLKVLQNLTTFGSYRPRRDFAVLIVEETFNAWLSLSIMRYKSNFTSFPDFSSLLFRLEVVMASVIIDAENCSLQPAILIKCIIEKGKGLILEMAYRNITRDYDIDIEGQDASRCIFLTSLLVYDVNMFVPNLMKVMTTTERKDDHRPKDEIMAFAVREIHIQNHCSHDVFEWYTEEIRSFIVNHFYYVVQCLIGDQTLHKSYIVSLEALSAMLLLGQIGVKDTDEIKRHISMLMLHWNEMGVENVPEVTVKAFLSFLSKSITLCSILPSTNANEGFHEFRNSTLSFMTKILPQVINNDFGSDNSYDDCCFLIISNLLKVGDILEITCLQDTLILCLKAAVDAVHDQLCPKLIEIARLIIVSVYGQGNRTEKIKILKPHEIHSMIFNHSKFDSLNTAQSKTKTGFLELLICCAAFSTETIVINTKKVTTLMTKFGSSLSTEDQLLRRLLFLYCNKHGLEKDETFFMRNLISWGSRESSDQQSFGNNCDQNHWEHFIEKLELRRIRKTINHFPLDDPVKFHSIMPHIETCPANNSFSEERIQRGTQSGGSIDEIVTSEFRKSRVAISKLKADFKEEDQRYSPGFIIPYTLVVLESFAETIEAETPPSSSSDVERDGEIRKRSHEYSGRQILHESSLPCAKREKCAKIVHRLCEKGVLGLSVMSLSSKCSELRKISSAVIYLFLQALKMKETCRLVSWRSRPQIEMIINSLQRGLVVMRAQKIIQNLEQKDEMATIPILPAVNALFLSRSLLTLANPFDDLYAPINKSFLRLVANHGAYTDFNSLPAFMTLFCSMNDNTDQARKDRLWALRLLKDGIVDSKCYRMASRRHVPELLLASFDAICSKDNLSSHEDECLALLETIQSLIKHGGSSSFYHHYNAIGILSWVRSSMEANILCSPSIPLRVSMTFMQVLHMILDKAVMESDSLELELRSCLDVSQVARGTVEWFNFFSEAACTPEQAVSYVTITSSILCSLCEIQRNDDSIYHQFLHPNGLPVKSCVEIIDRTKLLAPTLLSRTIFALCNFPFESDSLHEEEHTSTNFCQRAIESIFLNEVRHGESGDVSFNAILKRIADLSSVSGDREGALTNIEYLLGSRRILVTKYKCGIAWHSCIRTLVQHVKPDDLDSEYQPVYEKLVNIFSEEQFGVIRRTN